ncbi:unnamed protein product [Cercopithifilaria johnstoni]|uniref:USP domain-containing protein n=1 Tax=Cercopithifilaria johnstoni TaxID=2874296 RepID=A0A8J2M8U0_9BILA|nr:unnamed protein product [Cercopithifilaria johnstoni]
MVLYLTRWPVLINVGKDEVLLTDNLHQGFIELCNDGEVSSLRIFYLEDGEGRLERECIQISGLERAEDCGSLVFRICRLKSGADCNEHVLIKPERSKDCHTIYYAFRYLQQKRIGWDLNYRNMSLFNLVKRKNSEKVIPLRVKNSNQKRKPVTSIDIYEGSPNKRLVHKPEEEANGILIDPFTKQHPAELLKEEDRILEMNSAITKRNSPKKKITNLDDTFLCTHSKQSTSDLSTSFERLSAGTDAISQKGFLNLGNSCYMNAVLQGLFHVEAFKDLLNVVPESSKDTILSALNALQKNYQKAANAKKRCLLENVFKFLDDERFEMTEQEAAYLIFNFHIQIIIFRMLSFSGAEK